VDIIEDDLPIEADRAHQQLVEGTEAEAFHVSRMLVELADELLGVDVVQANGSVVGDSTEHLLHEEGELRLVYSSRVIGLGLDLLAVSDVEGLICSCSFGGIQRIEEGLCPV